MVVPSIQWPSCIHEEVEVPGLEDCNGVVLVVRVYADDGDERAGKRCMRWERWERYDRSYGVCMFSEVLKRCKYCQ